MQSLCKCSACLEDEAASIFEVCTCTEQVLEIVRGSWDVDLLLLPMEFGTPRRRANFWHDAKLIVNVTSKMRAQNVDSSIILRHCIS